jgi:argininosuccinate lyase
LKEWQEGNFKSQPADEDIHTANERRLGELIGPLAGKLHTGRSRNDQVATDVRLWMLEQVADLRASLVSVVKVMSSRAEAEIEHIMPGYTHMQASSVHWPSKRAHF